MRKHFFFTFFFLFCLLFCTFPGSQLSHMSEIHAAESNTVYKNKLQTIDGKLYYFDSKGKKLKSTWKTIQKKKYYFCADGHAAAGTYTIMKKQYLFSEKGVLLTNGFKTVNGKTYYVNSKGQVATGWKTIKKQKYCFTSKGILRTGWYKSGSKTYYLHLKTGAMYTGWKTIDGKTYYFSSSGVMAKSKWIRGKYVNKNGIYEPNKKASLSDLEKKLRSAIKSYSGTWSIYVKNLDNGASLCINNKKMYSASLIKLYAMSTAYSKIKQGSISESSTRGHISDMITWSSNDAFNTVIRRIGTTAINKWCKANGYKSTNQVHGLSPSSNNYGLRTKSGSNTTTVKDCGLLLESIYKGTCVSKSASQKMLKHLKGQQLRSKIPAGIPSGVTVANKTGETNDVTHDVAIVYSKGADYIICVMGRCPGYAYYATPNITKLSRIVYNYFN